MNRRTVVAVIFLCLVVCGTAAHAEQPQITWSHSTLTGQDAQARFITDRAECAKYAATLAPYPSQTNYDSGFLYTMAYLEAQKQEKQLFSACMYQRGWSTQVQ